MKTYEVNNGAGYISLPATVKKVVAHFKDGHTEEYSLLDFLVLKVRVKKRIVSIDCYDENDLNDGEQDLS